MSEGDSLIQNPAPLAQVESREDIDFKGEGATIRTLVSVQACPRGFRSRLGYHAKLYLTPGDGVEREIGDITAWRISRPTGVNPNIDPQYCRSDWYFKLLASYDESSRQLAYCFKAFYGPGIDPPRRFYDQVADEAKRNELRDGGNEIIFIETIYIKWREDPDDESSEYSGYGLAPIYLNTFYRLLGGKILPAWFSLSGPVTYLLLPRLHHDYSINDFWRHLQQLKGYTDEKLVEDAALRLELLFQTEPYGYEPYVPSVRVVNADISVLGRVVQPEDSLSIPGDRLLLPATPQISGEGDTSSFVDTTTILTSLASTDTVPA